MERLTPPEQLKGPHAPRVFVYGQDELLAEQREVWWPLLHFWPFALIVDGGWEIHIHLEREMEKRGGVDIAPNDRKATMHLWAGGPEQERTLVHELAHILLSPLDTVGGRAVEHLREVACDLQVRALVATCEESAVRLAEAILTVHRSARNGEG